MINPKQLATIATVGPPDKSLLYGRAATGVDKHGIRVGQVSPGPVVSALLSDWEPDRLQRAKDSGSLIEPSEVSEAILFMLTRSRNVTIRDMIVLPTNFDI